MRSAAVTNDLSIRAFLGVDRQNISVVMIAHGKNAKDSCIEPEAIAGSYLGAGANDNVMGDDRAETSRDGLRAIGHGLERSLQRRNRRITAGHAACAGGRFDWHFQYQPVFEFTGGGHSESTR
jgi:hypothetical protein